MLIPQVSANASNMVEYTRALHTPWEITNLALSLGGKPGGGLGIWNASYQKREVLQEMVERIKQKKQQLDPGNILNPGMWLSPPLFLSPSIFPVIMTITSKLDKMLPVKPEKQPEQLLFQETLSCTQCGYCMNYCPTKQEWLSSTPRGRLLMTRELILPSKKRPEIPQDYINSIYQCNTCGRCKVDCSVDIKSPELWLELRNELTKNGHEPEGIRGLVKLLQQTHNIAGKPNNSREDWTKKLKAHPLLDDKSSLDYKKDIQDIAYFTGCVTALYPMVHDIAISFVNILNMAHINCITLGGEEWCCGYPLLAAGHPDIALEFMEHNIAQIKKLGVSSVALTCPGCYQMWNYVYPRLSGKNIPFDILHSTQLLEKLIKHNKIKLGKLDNKVTYHDPCDIGRNSHLYNEPRYIISQIPSLNFVELRDSKEYCSCCGAGGDVMVSNPELARKISYSKVKEIVDTGANVLVTACPSCIRLISMARQEEKAQFNIWDITQLVWKSVVQSTGKSEI
jgi:heterodisulfide reductase subunit D